MKFTIMIAASLLSGHLYSEVIYKTIPNTPFKDITEPVMVSGVEIVLMIALLICAYGVAIDDVLREDIVRPGRVGLFCMTGTHCPNI